MAVGHPKKLKRYSIKLYNKHRFFHNYSLYSIVVIMARCGRADVGSIPATSISFYFLWICLVYYFANCHTRLIGIKITNDNFLNQTAVLVFRVLSCLS